MNTSKIYTSMYSFIKMSIFLNYILMLMITMRIKNVIIILLIWRNNGRTPSCHSWRNNHVHISLFILIVVRCSALSHPSNGYVICNNGLAVGSVCSYNCIDGYGLNTEMFRECRRNDQDGELPGQWSGEEAYCEGMTHSQVYLTVYILKVAILWGRTGIRGNIQPVKLSDSVC